MVDVARVKLFGHTVGTFRWDDHFRVAQFEYDKGFVGLGIEPSPIKMPVQSGRVYSFGGLSGQTFRGLPGMLADSLPDTYGRALFDKWLAMTGRTSGNPVETLCFLGKRCMGALEFEPAYESGRNPDRQFYIDALVGVARDALNEKQDFGTNIAAESRISGSPSADGGQAAIAEILRLGTSAGGQRAKAVIAYNKDTGEVRSGQADAPAGFAHYLLKLDGVSASAGMRETDNYGRLEYSFYLLARKCGIDMSECSLIEENGRAHFLTRRFDRTATGKVHMQTLCGIAHFDYRLLHGYAYEQAFGVMRALRLPYSQAREMFRRMVFNVVARNQDDHTKNISFLMDERGVWSLSPAYDMTYAYNPAGAWTATHQMSINGKFDNINRSDLVACAERNNIKHPGEIIDEVCGAVASWPVIAAECEVPQSVINAVSPNLLTNL